MSPRIIGPYTLVNIVDDKSLEIYSKVYPNDYDEYFGYDDDDYHDWIQEPEGENSPFYRYYEVLSNYINRYHKLLRN